MIKYLVMDVDGTLTDGKIYMGNDGELVKSFDVKDGAGIANILPQENITPIIITARESRILANRCKELNIISIHQGVNDKLMKLKEIVEDLSAVAYVGDDFSDIPCMKEVKNAGGLVLAPADAIPEIWAVSDYISGYDAGHGAVRDIIGYLVKYNKGKKDRVSKDKVRKAIEQILATDFSDFEVGEHRFIDGTKYYIHVFNTKDEKDCLLKSHRKHIDIHFMIEGSERIKIYNTICLSSAGVYDFEKDCEFWREGIESSESMLVPGSLIVIYNGQPYKGAIMSGESSEIVKKVVCSIEI